MKRVIIAIQMIVIGGLFVFIGARLHSSKPVFGTLKQGDFSPGVLSQYKYYYEPQASSTQTNRPKWSATTSINTINHDTLNERFDYSVSKPHDVFRIALLGDSFGYGLYNNTISNFAERLEDSLNSNDCNSSKKIELINFSVPAYDAEYEVERYRLRAQKYNPDLVMWFAEAGDFQQVSEIFQKNYQKHLTKALPGERHGFFDTPGDLFQKTWELARHDTNAEISASQTAAREQAAYSALSKLYAGPLVIFSIPPAMLSHDVSSFLESFARTRPHTYYTRDIGAPWSTAYQVLPDDGHPNEAGSVRVANELFTYLIKHDLVPCEKRGK